MGSNISDGRLVEKINNGKNDFVCLRTLRGFFILMIVFFHAGNIFGRVGAETFKLKYIYEYGGFLGNIFFFMSSGFLTCMVYKKRIMQEGCTFSKFFIGRLKKILPIYYLTNLLLLIYIYYINGVTGTSVDRILRTVLLIQSGWKKAEFPFNGVGWFVNVLFLLYVIFYLICYVSKCIGCESSFVYLTIAWCVVGYCIHQSGCTLPFLSWQNSQGYIAFSTGILTYEVWNYLGGQKYFRMGFLHSLFYF